MIEMNSSALSGVRLRSMIGPIVLALCFATGLTCMPIEAARADDLDQDQGHDHGRHEGERKREIREEQHRQELREQERRREIREEEARRREWEENRAHAYVEPRVVYAPPPAVYAPPPPPPGISLIFPLDIR